MTNTTPIEKEHKSEEISSDCESGAPDEDTILDSGKVG